MNVTVEWSSFPLRVSRLLLAQRLIVSAWSSKIINGGAAISSTSYRQLDTLTRVFSLIEEQFPGSQACELTMQDWVKILVLMIYRVWNTESELKAEKRKLVPVEEPLAKQTYERAVTLLKIWFNAYQSGEVNDGPEYLLTTPMVERSLKAELQRSGRDYEEWKRGGSYGSIPFVVTHLLLADALAVVRSNVTKNILAFFSIVSEKNLYNYLDIFWRSCSGSQIGDYRKIGDISILRRTVESDSKNSLSNDCKEKLVRPLHNELISIHNENGDGSIFVFPWKKFTDFRNDFNRVQTAVYIIFLSVMGKRGPSEVRTLRGCDITRSDEETGNDAVFSPSIWKSNKGMRQLQGVTNFIDDVMGVILKLGFKDKTGSNLPLFYALPKFGNPMEEPKLLSIDRAQYRLDNFYDDFCNKIADKVSFDVRASHIKIASHQFRHSFAEFALRRFDGNVEELIRQHFCHRYNHWWTRRYTQDKLDFDHINAVNRRYIRELVPRILLDSVDDPDYVGAIALFLKKTFGDAVRHVSSEEAELIIDEACKGVVQVTAHEYGWCLLHEEAYSAAKCRDLNGRPNPSSTSAEKCTGCANFCASRQSHLARQTQILLSHMDFLEQKIWKLPHLADKSRQAVRSAQAIFPQLKEYGDV